MSSTTISVPQSVHHSRFELEPEPEDWSADAVRAELHRVLQSAQFDASERNRRFLEYVIEETLAGRAGRIKAYNIATEVFGRDVNFDPQLDPVVRMEARRLRRSLERFYLIDGKGCAIRLAMPKGGYVPEFLSDAATLPASSEAGPNPHARLSAGVRGCSISVAPFDAEGDLSSFLHFNQGFTDQLLVGLSRFPEILVFGPGAIAQQRSGKSDAAHAHPDADFVLSGSTALLGTLVNVKAVLADGRTGRVVWGQTLERDLRVDSLLRLRDEMANRVVRSMAQPDGPMFGAIANRAAAKTSEALTPLESIARFSRYRMSRSRNLYHEVQGSLERSVAMAPDYAEARACLSQVYSDGYRFGFASDASHPTLVQRAVRLAQQAAELDSNSSRAQHALGLALWLSQDVQGSLKAFQAAIELNPNATEVRGAFGLQWILLGQWRLGLPLLEEGLAQIPRLPAPRDFRTER